MRSIGIVASLAVMASVGCGGGGGGSEKEERTYLACGTSEACLVMQSDVPAEMSCTAPEVPSCSPEGILGTCQLDVLALHFTTYVYDDSVLAEVEADCAQQHGTWIPAYAVP